MTVSGGWLEPVFQSVLLGIVEGLTEFLPVSSTAHLRIAEALMKIPLDDPYWKMYTIVIQVGAILALCILFLERIVNFLRTFPKGENGDRNWLTHPISLTSSPLPAPRCPPCCCTSGAKRTWAA
jgi:undecaprenyl pyrophosphate phosphatase UppP